MQPRCPSRHPPGQHHSAQPLSLVRPGQRTPWPSPLDRDAARGVCADEQVYVHVLEEDAYQLGIGLQEPVLTT